ncbi:MAG: transcription termination factor NusA [Planctomycetaceae bacterium]|nr:transcription termination factor NusA [Planctomycetaceae bacterium]
MNQELLRIIEALCRDKNIDKELVFQDLEAAVRSAIRKDSVESENVTVQLDRVSGEITATINGQPKSIRELGRIPAQTAKQVIFQRLREAERGSISDEFRQRRGQIVTGRTGRWEGGSMIVDLGRTEAFMPRSEQIPGESYQSDQRVRAMILDVREQPNQVRVILSRTHPDFIRALFELEVPEVAEGIIEIKALAREAGYRTKVAVDSTDSKVDAVGACVGVRGSRIRNIVDELGGEKIDIVRWNESSKVLIANSLKPAEVAEIALCFELGRATVVVVEDQLSLAIGKRGQNVRLAARLTNWDIDILTPNEFNGALDTLEKALRSVEGVDATVVDQIVAMGMVNVLDVDEVGVGPLVSEIKIASDLAKAIVARCGEEAKRVANEKAVADAAAKAAGKSARVRGAAAVEPTAAPEPPAGDSAAAEDETPPPPAPRPPVEPEQP